MRHPTNHQHTRQHHLQGSAHRRMKEEEEEEILSHTVIVIMDGMLDWVNEITPVRRQR